MKTTYMIKISTGENVPYDSKEEVLGIMHRVSQSLNTSELIPLENKQDGFIVHMFANHIIGYVELQCNSLEDIVSSKLQTFQEAKEEAAELNLYSEKYTP